MAAIRREETRLDYNNDLQRRAIALQILKDGEQAGPKMNCRAACLRQQFGELTDEHHEQQPLIRDMNPRLRSLWKQQLHMDKETTDDYVRQLIDSYCTDVQHFLTPPDMQFDQRQSDQQQSDIDMEIDEGHSESEDTVMEEDTDDCDTSERETLQLRNQEDSTEDDEL